MGGEGEESQVTVSLSGTVAAVFIKIKILSIHIWTACENMLEAAIKICHTIIKRRL